MIATYNPYSLLEKKILVTGASSGIGKSIAIECSKLGAKLVITGRNFDRLKETMSLLTGDGHILKVLDLNDTDNLQEFILDIPKLDGIVYCAGIQKTCPTKLIQRVDLDEVFETNFFSIIDLNTTILSKKLLNKEASIVFISSTAAGIVAEYGNAIYSATKGALTSFAKVLALELIAQRIRVNCILPGMIKTPLLNKILVDEEQLKKDEERYPLGYGNPEDVAYAVIYLLSNASKWITGTNLLLDGGLTLK
ncbi:MAG: SDR family oxidoreductase [Bacteroidetes bacterium]|nr:SDR family oxidoreductase [Bacteroidota bacterium]